MRPTPRVAKSTLTASRYALCGRRSRGPIFGRATVTLPDGKIVKRQWSRGSFRSAIFGQHEAGDEHAEGHRGQGQVEAAQPKRAEARRAHRPTRTSPWPTRSRPASTGPRTRCRPGRGGGRRWRRSPRTHRGQVDHAAVASRAGYERQGDHRQRHAEGQRAHRRFRHELAHQEHHDDGEAPAITAVRMDGSVDSSRARATVAPGYRSWGRTIRTMNSTIMGSEMRKLPVHVHRADGKYPMT